MGQSPFPNAVGYRAKDSRISYSIGHCADARGLGVPLTRGMTWELASSQATMPRHALPKGTIGSFNPGTQLTKQLWQKIWSATEPVETVGSTPPPVFWSMLKAKVEC